MEPDDDDIVAIAEAVRRDEDGYTPPEEMTAEPSPVLAMNLAAQIAALPVGKKLKLALRGNREARAILMRDPSIMVQRFLIENPRLTDDDVISIAKSRTIESEILGKVAKRRDWMRNYQVRYALVTNPRTPLGVAVGIVSTLQERDQRTLAKSHSVSSAVVTTARRIVAGRR